MQWIKNKLNNTNIDFVAWRYVAGSISAMMVILSWVLFFTVGPNWGIDFTGGTEVAVKFEDAVQIDEVRSALATLGLPQDSVQSIGGASAHQYAIRIQDTSFGVGGLQQDVESRLKKAYGDQWLTSAKYVNDVGARLEITHQPPVIPPQEVFQKAFGDMKGVVAVSSGSEDNALTVNLPGLPQQVGKEIAAVMPGRKFEVLAVEAISAKVGEELMRDSVVSIFATLLLIMVYVAFRFDLAYAPGAILSLFHDVSVVIGIFVVLQMEFNLPLIGALLTIVGYSLNDTIVIYDRIRENQAKFKRQDVKALVNQSMNETFGRTVATAFTTFISVVIFVFFGGPVLRDFMFAMLLGIVFGCYSTIYVATPMIIFYEDWKPFFSKYITMPGAGVEVAEGIPDERFGDSPQGEDEAPAELSASEMRRRQRAAAEKKGPDSP